MIIIIHDKPAFKSLLQYIPSTDLTGGLRRTLSPPDWSSAKKRLISINTNKMIWDTIN